MWYLRMAGRLDEAIAEQQRTVELDPLSPAMRSHLGMLYYEDRQFDLALQHQQRAIEIDPGQWFPHWLISLSYFMKGMHDKAMAAGERACRLSAGISGPPLTLGAIYLSAGKPEQAREMRNQLNEELRHGRNVSRFNLALYSFFSGEIDSAFEWLEQAVEERDIEVTSCLKTDPVFDNLRPDPRYRALLRKMNLE